MATAKEMTRQFPQIPMLEPAPDSSINGGRAGESGAGANALQNLAVARPPP
jgi:hypothetical protein